MTFTLDQLEQRIAEGRPTGYREQILGMATQIDAETFEIREPSLADLISNFTVAISKWTLAGWPTVSQAVFNRRLGPDGCSTCEFFDAHGRDGRGRCTHPNCGCFSEWKAFLKTERCPIGRLGWKE